MVMVLESFSHAQGLHSHTGAYLFIAADFLMLKVMMEKKKLPVWPYYNLSHNSQTLLLFKLID